MQVTYEEVWKRAGIALVQDEYQRAIDNGLLCLKFLNEQTAKADYEHICRANDAVDDTRIKDKKKFLQLKMLPCYILLSKSYILLNKKEEGSRFLSESVLLAKKSLYDDAAENAAIFSVLAEVFKILKDSKGEHAMLLEYMNRMEKEVGKNHVAVSDCYHLLAGFCIRNKQITLAIEYGEKCLANRLNHFGRINEVVDSSLYSLGLMYRAGGKLKEAFLTLLESIEIRTKLFGPTSLETAEAQESAGFTAFQMGEFKKAHILYKLSLDARKNIYGNEHKATKNVLKLYNTAREALLTASKKR
eukprot:g251.t1